MIWVVVSLALLATALAFVIVKNRQRREVDVVVPADLAERVAAACRAMTAAETWQPSRDPQAPPVAAKIEAALIANEPRLALDAGESALAADPDSAATRVWLAWALCANAEPAAALDQLAQARSRGATDGPLAGYVRARAEHLQFELAAGATGAIPALVTTADLAVVTLARGRGGAAWLTGGTEVQLSSAQVRAAVAEHRDITARSLQHALVALALAPGFVECAYLVARLAIKAGLVTQGRTLFDILAPRMTGRPDAHAFERDRKDLDDPNAAVANAKTPPLDGKAKRSRSLRVLS